jgi:hypothetical protein
MSMNRHRYIWYVQGVVGLTLMLDIRSGGSASAIFDF